MRRLRRSTKQYLTIVSLSLLILGSAFAVAYVLILKKIENNYGVQLEALLKEQQYNQRHVYEALQDISVGDCLSEELVQYKEVYTSQAQSTFIQKEDFGKVCLISIPKGTYVQRAMLAKAAIEDTIRETTYNCIQQSGNVATNDFVDVRLFYPNGENYIVLSKKMIKSCSEDGMQTNFWLSEEEILMMSSAIVDAYLYDGAYLYTTKYVQPTIQEPSIVTYQVSIPCQKLIENNPNIVEIAASCLSTKLREFLENRLTNGMTTGVNKSSWNVSNSDSTEETSKTIKNEEKYKEYFYYPLEEEAREDAEYGD